MADDFKLIGYSSDDLTERIFPKTLNKNSMRFGKPVKTKSQRLQDKRDKLFSKEPPLELDEWFVYFVDGEKWYYKVAQDLKVLQMHHVAEFLGIGQPKYVSNNQINKVSNKQIVNNEHGACCYCEKPLKPKLTRKFQHNNKTKDHVIPRNRGGKIVRDCCYECNQEKGGLMLHTYIQYLELMINAYLYEAKKIEVLRIKLKNAKKIYQEIYNELY